MPLILRDRVQETTTTLGTGTITLAGAVSGFQSFSVIGNGNTTYYTIVSQTSNEWEVGIGTYTSSGTTLSRDTVLESSNGGSLVNFSAGTKNVFVTYPAEKSVYKDASEDVTLPDTLTAATVAIDAPTTDATFTNDTGITGWVYSGKGFSVNAQESAPTGLFFKPDGTKMYVTGSSGDDVNEYNLGTAWDVTTASFVAVSTGITQDTAPQDLFFKDDGLTLFVIGDTNNTVYQYTLSVAWDITTATYSSKSFSVATQETTPVGMWFKSDGTTMYIVGTGNDTVYQYTLSTPWDISTASYASISFSVAAQDTSPSQVVLSADGTKMWVLGNIGDDINEYTLGTAWNVSTATFVNNVYVGFQEITPTGLFIDSTAANRVYVVGQSSDTVFQYNTVTNTVDAMTDRLFVSGEGYVDGNTFFGSNVNIDLNINSGSASFGTTSISGGLTASSSVNFSGTTSNISVGTAQTTGLLTLGGTTQTGAITVGQSTGAQTLNLGTGATTSATTKTINIGTAGVSGSTTTINIGSAVSGALGNISMGNSGTQFLVAPTTSAVNYVQVTGATTTNRPVISAQGSDSNISFDLNAKGAAAIRLQSGSANIFRLNGVASAVNFFDVYQSATTKTPYIQATGTDSNVPFTILTTGTGAINLAPGSSGVNISNGGTVTAITRTNAGTNYTSAPAVAITAPTTAGGVQATATSSLIPTATPTITSGGTGYTVNDVLTFVGGTGTAVQMTVTAVSGGVITAATSSGGGYSVVPSNPISVTGGTGTGATFTVSSWSISSVFTITNAGSGYVEQPTVTFSGGGGSGAAAYATVGSTTKIQSLGTTMNFFTPNSNIGLQVYDSLGTGTGYWRFPAGFSNNATMLASSTGGNISTGGASDLGFFTNNVAQRQFNVAHTASAVNYVQVTGAATGGAPTISAQGSDTNIQMNILGKGTGVVVVGNNSRAAAQFTTSGLSTVNYLQLTAAVTSSGPILSSVGTDTNIDINLTTKGTGAVRFNTGGGEQLRVTDAATAVNYVEITGSATGSRPSISAQGSDTNLGLQLSSKGTRSIVFYGRNFSAIQFATGSTNSAVNYLQAEGQITGAGPDLSAQGSDTNIDINLTTKGTGVVNLNTGAGTQVRIIDSGGTAVNRIHLQGQATGFFPVIASRGSDTNLGMSYSTQGTGPHDFYTDGTSFAQQFKVSHTASAVNYVQVTGAATGSEPTISAQGSDSSVSLNLAGKGASGFVQFTVNSILRGRFGASGVVDLGISSSGGTGFQISATTNQVNYLQAAGAIASSGPVLSAQGSDTNIDLNLTPKGTGTVVVNGPLTATSSIQNTRINPRAVAAGATSGSLTINGDTTDLYEAEGLTGAITFLQPSGTPVDGQRLIIRIKDNGTARGITWTTTSGAFRAIGVTLPTTTVLSKVTYVGCIYNATDVFWDVIAAVTQA